MPIVTVATRIEAPPEAITAVMLDAAKAPLWTAGLERLEVVSGAPGSVGSVGRAHYVEGRRRYVLEDVLEAVTPNRRFVSRIRGGGIEARIQTTLEPIGDEATRLTLRWDGRGTNPITMVLLPLMKRRIAHRAAADLSALRRLVEEGGELDAHTDAS